MRKLFTSIAVIFLLVGPVFAADMEVKPEGRIYFNLNYNISGYPDWDERAGNNDFTEFELDRAYLGLKAKFGDQWTARITGDVTRFEQTEVEPLYDDNGDLVDVDVSEKTGPYTYYVKYAYANYQPFNAFGIRLGAMPTPFIDRYEDAWGYRFVEKTPSDRVKWDSSSDLGAGILGEFPGNYGSYIVMVRNGEGYKKPETDSGKAAHARLLVRPLQINEATKDLQLTGAYRYERVEREDPEVTSHMINALLSYKYMFTERWGINFGAGYDHLVTETDIEGEDAITGQIIHGYGVFYMPYSLALFGRVDMVDPDLNNDKDTHGYQDEHTYILGGISVEPVNNIAFALDYKSTRYTEEVEDDNGNKVVKAADSFIYIHTKIKF